MALSWKGVFLKNWSLSGDSNPPDGQPQQYYDSQGRLHVWDPEYGGYVMEEVVVIDSKPQKVYTPVPPPDSKPSYTWVWIAGALIVLAIIMIAIKRKK